MRWLHGGEGHTAPPRGGVGRVGQVEQDALVLRLSEVGQGLAYNANSRVRSCEV